MSNPTRFALVLLVLLLVTALTEAQRTSFDKGWRFSLGNAANPNLDFGFNAGSSSAFAKAGTDVGPIGLGADDADWRTVDLPHDWVVELPFDANSDVSHGCKPIGHDHPQNSIGWYRKEFDVSREDEAKRFRITFDGVYRNALFWINGHFLGRNESGYIGVTFDLTDYVKFGSRNVIAVRVDASDFEGWFYEGAGIYRHVWLTRSDPIHFPEDGVEIQAVPSEDGSAVVSVRAEISNETDATTKQAITIRVLDAGGEVVGTSTGASLEIAPRGKGTATAQASLKSAHRWSVDDPYLYRCEVSCPTDRLVRDVGFRTFRFDPDHGFFLNGKPLKIQGTCNHQDHAGVGSAIPDSLNLWRIAQLKKFGCNAYRTSHNAPTPEVLDACDRLGVLVLDETRMFGSTGEAESQLERLVRRDRNHPSVIAWSIGNEEWATQGTEESARIASSMMRTIKASDPTRPVTFAANNGGELNGINSIVDVRGFNYGLEALDDYHRARPAQPIWGSEVASTVTDRGGLAADPAKGYLAPYDVKGVGWGESAEGWWRITLARDWFAGGFVWTGFDYRGEPTPYGWPNVSSHFGILDTCGFPKDLAYYYHAWWTREPVLHIFPDWNHRGMEGQPVDVWVFSNHDEVELFLNGRSLGRKPMTRGGHLAWRVPFEPGRLSAVGYRKGEAVQEAAVETTGPAVRLELETESPSGPDAAVVNVMAVDAQGRLVPDADMKVDFKLEGKGRILGVGNGDPSCHEADKVVATPTVAGVERWKMKVVTGDPASLPEVAADFDDSSWSDTDLRRNQIHKEGEMIVLRASIVVEDPAGFQTLAVGPIDDLGWVYLNGKLIGTTDDWAASHRFDVARKLVKGRNVLAIVAKNNGGEGGLTRAVRLLGPEVQPNWSRSLFRGLAQVIVSSAGGSVSLRASSGDLEPATLTLP